MTATNALKPATVETGAVVNVPMFVNEGDTIRVYKNWRFHGKSLILREVVSSICLATFCYLWNTYKEVFVWRK